MTLFCLARLISVTYRQELQTSEISSKAINYSFNKTLHVCRHSFSKILLVFFTVNAHHTKTGLAVGLTLTLDFSKL